MQCARRWIEATAGSVVLGITAVGLAQGQLVGWGLNQYNDSQPPIPSMLPYRQVVAGGGTNYAIRSDGTLLRFGYRPIDAADELGVIRQVAAGDSHAYIVLNDGSLLSEGYYYDGQRDTPAGLGAVRQLACGRNFTLALRNEG
ncbi:MAG: hypothetical protein EBQ99_08750, partial [Planctomycetes bacterium]|nr:hypothetical protein [Planctomycetota bacterium]